MAPELQADVAEQLASLSLRRSAKWARYEADVLPAWVAEMDFPLAEPVVRTLTEALERSDTGYAAPDAAGLGEAFAGFARRRLDWDANPAEVVPIHDVVGGIDALIELLTDPGEGVLVTPPVYHPFFSTVADRGRKVIEVPLTDGLPDVAAIERAFAAGARALLLCSPHNPTGTVVPERTLAAIGEAADAHDAWVLADEIHAPLTLPGATHTSYLTVSDATRRRGFALSSASKTFNLAGLGCAQLITAGGEARAAAQRLPAVARHAGHLGVLGAVAAFEEGDEWLDAVLGILAANRELLGELLADRLPEARWQPPEAGYLAWIDLSAYAIGPDPAATLLERGRIALSPGIQFGPGGEGYVRMNFGTTPALVEEAVERIARGVGR